MFLFKVVDLKNSVYEAHLISWKLKQSHFIVFKNFIVKGNCLIKIMMVIGYMLRKCIDVDGEPTWGRPNFEHCVSQAMKNIFNEVLVIMISIKERCGAFRYENVYPIIRFCYIWPKHESIRFVQKMKIKNMNRNRL